MSEAKKNYDEGQRLLTESKRHDLNVAYRTLLATQANAHFAAAAALSEVRWEQARERLYDAMHGRPEQNQVRDELVVEALAQQADRVGKAATDG